MDTAKIRTGASSIASAYMATKAAPSTSRNCRGPPSMHRVGGYSSAADIVLQDAHERPNHEASCRCTGPNCRLAPGEVGQVRLLISPGISTAASRLDCSTWCRPFRAGVQELGAPGRCGVRGRAASVAMLDKGLAPSPCND